jgi:hypothetical protein
MPPVGFETTVSVDERPQTYALDLVATGTDKINKYTSTYENTTHIHNITCIASPYLSNNGEHKINTNLAHICKVK